ncbi:hypothetical protein EDC14_101351 [Hydrogenispora ethanolica]|jgi:uncharacterized membrane protein YfcA|uniref:Probable membrane transporter protein n=1 Tax=Hydrogenispora ethanolica TaxID=1082276 RepID=A0A4R1RQ49_HYDET|nr:sulfite exporter TauE/SafE family protein [Hydrogenispora ethanolica]TCL68511.1 hypothetical protein EDC14_101351 [Hydrogenispora ethanolica]
MFQALQSLHLSPIEWGLGAFCALLFGFSKTGINGVSTLAIPIMAAIFGGKTSAGVVLPMLITGDLMAVRHYSRHANWSHIRRLIPWTLGGLVIGLLVGRAINDRQFKAVIAISVLVCLGLMVWLERNRETLQVPDHWGFAAAMGLAGGFTTMIGNAAGPVMTLYFLSMRLSKYDFIGTGAWFFALVNLTKLPLQIFFWQAISPATLAFNAVMIPGIVAGAVLGIWVVRRIPERPFRVAVMILTVAAAVKLLF